MEVSLHVLAGKRKGKDIPLPPTLFVIGRDNLCHLRPHSALVSRRHCAIARWGDKILLRDLKSGNGTFLNGKKVENEVRVKDGDTLQIGDLMFKFHIKDEADADASNQKDNINWLIGVPADSAVLDPAESTVVVHLEEPTTEEQTVTNGSKDLSAGKYLRDYLTTQTNKAKQTTPQPKVM